MRQQLADYRVFWREFRQAYHSTGAVLPSGRALSRALARFVRDGEGDVAESLRDSEMAVFATANLRSEKLPYVAGRRILEVGPGTGAVTDHIVSAMRPNDQLILVERNEQFVEHLRGRLVDSSMLQSAANRIRLMHSGVEVLPEDEPFDLIISGLPLNNFSVESVEQILTKLRRLLSSGGTLSFFEYVAVRRAKALVSSVAERARLRGIERLFGGLLRTQEIRRDLVLANVPPAWVHHVRFTAGRLERGAGSMNSGSVLPAPCSPPQ